MITISYSTSTLGMSLDSIKQQHTSTQCGIQKRPQEWMPCLPTTDTRSSTKGLLPAHFYAHKYFPVPITHVQCIHTFLGPAMGHLCAPGTPLATRCSTCPRIPPVHAWDACLVHTTERQGLHYLDICNLPAPHLPPGVSPVSPLLPNDACEHCIVHTSNTQCSPYIGSK